MRDLPESFAANVEAILDAAHQIDGWLTDREIRFLALLAAWPTAEGRILEFGPYQGKSTVVLAKAAQFGDGAPLVTVDIRNWGSLEENLARNGVSSHVEVHFTPSRQFALTWNHPVRLFWHDGDNHYDTVRDDVANIMPHLVDGAIVAFHDVLNESGDRVRVFMDSILSSPHFGDCGMCGSIGWAQYRVVLEATAAFAAKKQALRKGLARVSPYQGVGLGSPRGWRRVHYKLLRTLVRHGEVQPKAWLKRVA